MRQLEANEVIALLEQLENPELTQRKKQEIQRIITQSIQKTEALLEALKQNVIA